MRLLRDSLTPEQIKRVRGQVSGHWTATEYSFKRLKLWKVSGDELADVLRMGILIEWHNEAGTRRILLRRRGLCIVLDLDKHVIITAYRNPPHDHHVTIDLTKYDEGPVEDRVLDAAV